MKKNLRFKHLRLNYVSNQKKKKKKLNKKITPIIEDEMS